MHLTNAIARLSQTKNHRIGVIRNFCDAFLRGNNDVLKFIPVFLCVKWMCDTKVYLPYIFLEHANFKIRWNVLLCTSVLFKFSTVNVSAYNVVVAEQQNGQRYAYQFDTFQVERIAQYRRRSVHCISMAKWNGALRCSLKQYAALINILKCNVNAMFKYEPIYFQ